jgi:hypothetical protein
MGHFFHIVRHYHARDSLVYLFINLGANFSNDYNELVRVTFATCTAEQWIKRHKILINK